ncbi:tRNA-uridine aminocarboxypropyltransferase [Aliamphritea hakodatensis]|uniref:tRNA-uridine aminocarboxypropyltransferase n=1 Tax=Aliamphritea hakodatensis TaxID=2895352 RepID=UPI0022FD5652|nr:DTW domain-containing protein [Aliamphritea hakodatensis]
MNSSVVQPRRPYLGRGATVERCESCFLRVDKCICELRSAISAQVEFCLLTHNDEVYKPSNTGRLIRDSIAGTRRFIWHRKEADPELLALIQNPQVNAYIVFPPGDDYAERMAEFVPQPDKRSVFIVLDGTWRQARRMFRLSEYLQGLAVISLKNVPVSRYELRKAVHDNQLCTAEVAIALLGEIGDHSASAHLQRYFDAFTGRYLETRSQKVTAGISDDARG